jgi:hypothetical protein
MQLDTFISETLKAIIKGIKDSQDFAKENGGVINPKRTYAGSRQVTKLKDGERFIHTIDFDIAVTASNEQQNGVNGGITVFGIGLGAKIADKEVSQTISRIKFNVDVSLPESSD